MEKKSNERPPYILGLLCLIPLVGLLVGAALIFYSIFKYHDKKLTLIGVSGVIVTVVFYSMLSYDLKYGKGSAEAFGSMSQTKLNSLVNVIELYKIKEGQYPDSLAQLKAVDSSVSYHDPLVGRRMGKSVKARYQYQKLPEGYKVFSAGEDCLPNTKDDIYPTVLSTGNLKYGFVKKQ
ncbi:type II secretion system protein GspG [Taibaiella soli]|uniref:Type II secretion system protein GspG C-terminal domain-containing protein n=1 Tax=Taibaiella soli TaxID=1649169 RepID=A0A2W2AJN5_9BACT|nr:type II secretion system protein GspG [Taibaiella soli]PZF73752.1 hypothetical protein DN068_07075 [Taibaiella soli]